MEDFADAKTFGFYIDQTPITKDFCEQNPYESRLDAKFERLNMEITYLEQIYDSVSKGFMRNIDHLDYHPTMDNAEQTGSKDLPVTSQPETLQKKQYL